MLNMVVKSDMLREQKSRKYWRGTHFPNNCYFLHVEGAQSRTFWPGSVPFTHFMSRNMEKYIRLVILKRITSIFSTQLLPSRPWARLAHRTQVNWTSSIQHRHGWMVKLLQFWVSVLLSLFL